MTKRKIGIIVGSLREGSYSKKIAKTLIGLFPTEFEASIIEIGNLEFYNEDLDVEGNVPPAWQAFRETIAAQDAFIFVTPEYNRSFPAVIKNAIDVGSRPYGKNLWNDKVAAVVSTSIGNISGFGANHHLRQSLVFLNMHTLAQPEAYLGDTGSMFDENDQVKNAGTLDFMQTIVNEFIALYQRLN